MAYDFLVIGGGLSGMSVATLLASHGRSVALVEKNDRLAPTIRGFRRNGLFFDSGFHYAGAMGEGETLHQMLEALGLSGDLVRKPLDQDAFDCLRFVDQGIEFKFCCGWQRLQQRLVEACPNEEEAIEQYLHAVREIFESYPRDLLTGGFDANFIRSEWQKVSLGTFLNRITDNDLLKAILTSHGLLYGVKPGQVSFAYHACIVGSYYQSAYSFEGGGGAIVQAFEKRLAQLGVDVFLEHDVDELVFSDDGELHEARIAEGPSIPCRTCVSTIHPHILLELVPRTFFRPAYRKRVSALEDTPSAWVMYIESRTGPSKTQDGNLFLLPGTGTQNWSSSVPVDQRPLFLAHSWEEHDPSRRALSAICMAQYKEVAQWGDSALGNRPDDYRIRKREVMEAILHRVQASAGDWVGEIELCEGASALTFRDYMNSPNGSLYGIRHSTDQVGLAPKTKLDSLFVSGQALVGPGLFGTILGLYHIRCHFGL